MTTLNLKLISKTKSKISFFETTTKTNIKLNRNDFINTINHFKSWHQEGSSFNSHLYNLIAKADDINKIKLLKSFPCEVVTYLLWYTSKDEEKFLINIKKEL